MQPKLNAQTIISFYYLYMMSSSRDRFDFLCVEKYNSIFCNNFFPVSDIFIHHHPHLLEHQTQRGDKTTSRSLLLLNLKQGKVSKVKKKQICLKIIFLHFPLFLVHAFLAVMSCSRSDVVRLFVCSLVRQFGMKEFFYSLRSYKGVSKMSNGCFNEVSMMFHGQEVSMVLKKSLKSPSRVF